MHINCDAYFFGMACNPGRRFGIFKEPRRKSSLNQQTKITVRKVAILLHKRSLGLPISKCATLAGWNSDGSARAILKRLNLPKDVPRHSDEVKSSVVSEYVKNISITEISKKYKIPTTSIFRWVTEAGELADFSSRKAHFCSIRPIGNPKIGKKNVFHTSKGGSWISTDSNYELARLSQLEDDESVVELSRCRDRIRYEFGGKKRTYIPDFTVRYSDGAVFVEEIKPSKWEHDELVIAKRAAAELFYSQSNVQYRIVTEAHIGSYIQSTAQQESRKQDPEYIAALKERRREQKRIAQRAYVARTKTR